MSMTAEEKEGGKYDNYNSHGGYEAYRRSNRYLAKTSWDVGSRCPGYSWTWVRPGHLQVDFRQIPSNNRQPCGPFSGLERESR